jgi:hypothetical protein
MTEEGPANFLVGYTVVQEFGVPFWTADLTLRIAGEDDDALALQIRDLKNNYIKITQTDAVTGVEKVIFYGFVRSERGERRKGDTTITLNAVTNGWFLTQQNVPKGSCASTQNYFFHTENGKWWVYPALNEINALLSWLWYVPQSGWEDEDPILMGFGSGVGYGSYEACILNFPGSSRCFITFPSVNDAFGGVCGLAPDPTLAAEVDLAWSPTDCQGRYSPEKHSFAFDYFSTTKWDAIMELSDHCDRVFHIMLTETDQPTCVAYWTPRDDANNDLAPPFDRELDIDAENSDELINYTWDDRVGEVARPKSFEFRSIGEYDFWLNEAQKYENNGGTHYWWDWARWQIHPVIKYIDVDNLDESELNVYAHQYILDRDDSSYSIELASCVTTRGAPYDMLYPGSKIRLSNVEWETGITRTGRITKIVHRKEGAGPATTTIEFRKINDLSHPTNIGRSDIDRLLEQKIERGSNIPVKDAYQNLYNPHGTKIGETAYITPVTITNTSNGLATVLIPNTSRSLDSVIDLGYIPT